MSGHAFRYAEVAVYSSWEWPKVDALRVVEGVQLCRRGQHDCRGLRCWRYRVGADGAVGFCGHRRKLTRRKRKALPARDPW